MERKPRRVTVLLEHEALHILEIVFALEPNGFKQFLELFIPAALQYYWRILDGSAPKCDTEAIFADFLMAEQQVVLMDDVRSVQQSVETMSNNIQTQMLRVIEAYVALHGKIDELPKILLSQQLELLVDTGENPTVGTVSAITTDSSVEIRAGPEEGPTPEAFKQEVEKSNHSTEAPSESNSTPEKESTVSLGFVIALLLMFISILVGLLVYMPQN